MAENTKIQWCHATFNPWRGCAKVSPGCANCYAETRLFALIDATPHLDWLLLTKRPENISQMQDGWGYCRCDKCGEARDRDPDEPDDWMTGAECGEGCGGEYGPLIPRGMSKPPKANVWLGVSVENQEQADKRIPLLLQTPAAVRFLSCEPLLGPVILHKYFALCECGQGHGFTACPNTGGVAKTCERSRCVSLRPLLSWVIIGGESGPGARPCRVEWIRSLVEQCRAAGVACFVKQLGSNVLAGNAIDPLDQFPNDAIPRFSQGPDYHTATIHLRDRKGGDPEEWPHDLRIREFPKTEEITA